MRESDRSWRQAKEVQHTDTRSPREAIQSQGTKGTEQILKTIIKGNFPEIKCIYLRLHFERMYWLPGKYQTRITNRHSLVKLLGLKKKKRESSLGIYAKRI